MDLGEEVRHAKAVGKAEVGVNPRVAQVTIGDDDLFSVLGKDDGEIGDGGGFAFAGLGGGDHEGAQGLIHAGEGDVGAQGAVGFGGGGARVTDGDGGILVRLMVVDDAQDGELELAGDVFRGLDGVIQGFAGNDHAGSEEESNHGSEEGVLHDLGLYGGKVRHGGFNLHHGGDGLGLREADGLIGLEQVGVDLTVLGDLGVKAAAVFIGDGVVGLGLVIRDLGFQVGELGFEGGLGLGEAGGLDAGDLGGEHVRHAVGDGSGEVGVGGLSGDLDELGIADGSDGDELLQVRGGVGKTKFGDNLVEDGVFGHHLGIGAGELLRKHDGGIVRGFGGGSGVDEHGGG